MEQALSGEATFGGVWRLIENSAEKASRYWAKRLGIPSEDVLQDAKVAAWEACQRYAQKSPPQVGFLALTIFRNAAKAQERGLLAWESWRDEFDVPIKPVELDWRLERAREMLSLSLQPEDLEVLLAVLLQGDSLEGAPGERSPIPALARLLGRNRRSVERSLSRLRDTAKEFIKHNE